MDARDRQRNLDRLIDRVESGQRGGSQTDREALLEFSDRLALLRSEYSTHRHEKLLRHCTIISEGVGGLAESLTSRDAAESIVRWINREYTNEETNKDYRIALRMFGKRVAEVREDVPTNDKGVPESLTWVPTTTSRSYDPKPDPGDMLDWTEDVRPMIDAAMNPRDSALIAVAWDAGPRAGELQALRVGDVNDHKHGLQISVDGKRGQRSITLITSVPYLSLWLGDHPRKNDPGAPLWCKLQSGEEISYQMARKAVREAARRAGVTKPVNFTNFRASSASYLASQGVNQSVLEAHHGWKTGSPVAGRYVSVFSEASDREIARAHGADVTKEEPDPIAAFTCPRCERKTPREEPSCVWCYQVLDQKSKAEIDEDQEKTRREILGFANRHPEVLQDSMDNETFIEVVIENPDIARDAKKLREATDQS